MEGEGAAAAVAVLGALLDDGGAAAAVAEPEVQVVVEDTATAVSVLVPLGHDTPPVAPEVVEEALLLEPVAVVVDAALSLALGVERACFERRGECTSSLPDWACD